MKKRRNAQSCPTRAWISGFLAWRVCSVFSQLEQDNAHAQSIVCNRRFLLHSIRWKPIESKLLTPPHSSLPMARREENNTTSSNTSVPTHCGGAHCEITSHCRRSPFVFHPPVTTSRNRVDAMPFKNVCANDHPLVLQRTYRRQCQRRLGQRLNI